MKHSPEDLEKFIHQTLRALPARRAPHSLESRVRAAIDARAALPWWKQGYAHWPVAVRLTFFVLSAAVAAILVALIFALTHSAATAQAVSEASARLAWLELARTVADSAGSIYQAIPPLWLYGTLAVLAACYATLVGVGAAAYRAFTVQR
jgi:hypothetical protein